MSLCLWFIYLVNSALISSLVVWRNLPPLLYQTQLSSVVLLCYIQILMEHSIQCFVLFHLEIFYLYFIHSLYITFYHLWYIRLCLYYTDILCICRNCTVEISYACDRCAIHVILVVQISICLPEQKCLFCEIRFQNFANFVFIIYYDSISHMH